MRSLVAAPATRRRALGACIVLLWAGTMALLLRRELGARLLAPAPPGEALVTRSRESWIGIFAAARQPLGFAHLTSTPERRGGAAGVALRIAARMKLRLAGEQVGLYLSASLWRAVHEPRGEVEARVRSGEHDLRFAGTVASGELRGTISSAGETLPVRAPVDAQLLEADWFSWRLPKLDLHPGEEVTFEALDPLTLKGAACRLRLVGEENLELGGHVAPARVVEVTAGGTRVRAWLDQAGEVVQAETPFGLTLRAITREQALAATEAVAEPELLEAVAITPQGGRPLRGAHRMVVRISGVAEGTLVPIDDTQQAGGEPSLLRIEAPRPPTPGAPALPGTLAAPAGPDLACDALIQCDSPRIRAQAAAIAGAESDPWRRAERINTWLFGSLRKRPVASVPSALDVLATREGDCNEHTVLFTALARALGIPTRIAVGVVWSNELEAFAYHAWPEVYAGRWIWMDPTLGQTVADATHLKLVEGGIESWPQVLPFLGRLKLEVLEVE